MLMKIPPLSRLLGVAQPFDPEARFVTSWLLSPLALAILRLLLSLWAFLTTFVTFGLSTRSSNGQSFSFFTNLTYWGLGFYFAVAGSHTLSYWAAHRAGRDQVQSYSLQRWGGVAQALHRLLYVSVTTFPFIVTIVFWGLLFSPGMFNEVFSRWSNISHHALNSLLALLEILLPRTRPQPALYMLGLVLILGAYLALAFLTHATQRFWVYSFLDPTLHGTSARAGYIIGILLGTLIVFGVVQGAVWTRWRLTSARRERATGFGIDDGGRDADGGRERSRGIMSWGTGFGFGKDKREVEDDGKIGLVSVGSKATDSGDGLGVK